MTLRFITLSFLINLLVCCALCAQDQTIPALHHWVAKKGNLAISARSSLVVDPSIHEMLRSDLQTFQNELFVISNLRLAVKKDAGQGKPGDIVIKPGNDLDKDSQAEGYKLNITDRVTINASSATGFFYGMQTLLQSLMTSKDKLTLNQGNGYDFPTYKERGVMLDVGRKYFEVAYIKKTIRDLAWYKLNFLHLHFTEWHSFRLQSTLFPGLAAKESYSKKDIAEIEAYAQKFHVTIVPEIDLPAHATAITNYNPNLGFDCPSMREAKWQGDSTNRKGQAWVLDVTKPETKIWVKALLDEFIPLFHGPYFHVGGDEWQYDNQKETCPELMKATRDSGFQNPTDVFVDFMNDISNHVKSRGKTAQIWSWWNYSPSAKESSKYSVTPDKDIVINIWNGPAMKSILNEGYKAIVTIEEGEGAMYVTPFYGKKPGDYGYFDSKKNYETWQPLPDQNILGFKLCIWADNTERMPDEWFDGFADLPKAVLSERTWSKANSQTIELFKDRVQKTRKASDLFGIEGL